MEALTRAVLTDHALIAARERHFVRLSALFAGTRLDDTFFVAGVRGQGRANPYLEPEQYIDEALDDLATHADALRDPLTFRPLVIEMGPYGVHFIDHIFGADVFDLGDQAPTWNWQVHYLETPVGALEPPDLEKAPAWRLAQRLCNAFLAAGVTVPVFGLPTIASALNIAVNLYGERILTALYTDAQAARHDLRVITDVLCALHRWYRARVPAEQLQLVIAERRTQPRGFGQICGCTNSLLSPGLYRDFVAPLDDEVLSVYPHGGMIHLCGTHTQHIPAWREMASVRALQFNDRAAEDLPIYAERLRPDQVLYVRPCETVTIDDIMGVTAGVRTVIMAERPGGKEDSR